MPQGPTWLSFHYPANQTEEAVDTIMTLKSEIPADVYLSIGADSDPNTYTYDAVFRNVT